MHSQLSKLEKTRQEKGKGAPTAIATKYQRPVYGVFLCLNIPSSTLHLHHCSQIDVSRSLAAALLSVCR
jgi:hypothetical protein